MRDAALCLGIPVCCRVFLRDRNGAGELIASCRHTLVQNEFLELIFELNRAIPFLKYLPLAESSVLEEEVLSAQKTLASTPALWCSLPSCSLLIHQCQFCFVPKVRFVCHSGSDSSNYFQCRGNIWRPSFCSLLLYTFAPYGWPDLTGPSGSLKLSFCPFLPWVSQHNFFKEYIVLLA